MLFHFAAALVFALTGCLFLAVTLLLGKLLRPATPDAAKGMVYECGEKPLGGGWFNYNPRFYIVALAFLIFDVEVVFTYPVATVLRRWIATGEGLVALVEIGTFVLVLGFALAYVWARGDLEWLREPTATASTPARTPE